MKTNSVILAGVTGLAISALAGSSVSQAAQQARPGKYRMTSSQTGSSPQARDASVDEIRQKYWAQGEERELGVVQNRLYSKDSRFEIDAFGGWITTDPFLSVHNAGLRAGYHFNEYFSVHALGWKSFVSPSSALTTLRTTLKTDANTNEPRSYAGGELAASALYGKLSLFGKSILYYDLHFMGGAGVTSTENGDYFTPSLGIGQSIYLTRNVALRADFREMVYQEQIRQKIIEPTGGVVEERTNWNSVFTLGFAFLL